MSKKGHEVAVIAPTYPGCNIEEEYHNYKIIRLDFKEDLKIGILYHLRALNFLPAFANVLRKFGPEIVHFQYTNPFGVLFFISRIKGIKTFASAHGNDILFFSSDWFAKRILRVTLKNINGTFAVSDNSKQLLHRNCW